MDSLSKRWSTPDMTKTTLPPTDIDPVVRDVPASLVTRALARRSYAMLATASPAGRPHAAGVLYAAVGSTLYVSTDLDSRKGRNLATNPHVGVTVPVRRLPIGPPSAIQFQATADVLAVDDPQVTALAESGAIKRITGHGELERPYGCIVRIIPSPTVHTYGLGMSLWGLVRNPLNAAGRATLPL